MRGWLALAGGDEFGRTCEMGDRALLAALGGNVHVAVLPTAQADGGSNPVRAGNNGVRYFTALGAEASNVMITDRASAADPVLIAQLEQASLIYLVGGNPGYLLRTLRDTPAWEAIVAAWSRGVAVAGASAGAMVLCAAQRGAPSGSPEPWIPALGLVPQTLAAVHHERASEADTFKLLKTLPKDYTIVGVDACAIAAWRPDGAWQMLGNGSVRVYQRGLDEPIRYTHGQTWTLRS